MKKRVLTGIKPTGEPHLGNLAGAILPAIEFTENNKDHECLFFIADYHSLTTVRDPQILKKYTYEIAATWLAFGLDPNKVLFYRQSDIPEIMELNWILSCLTSKGDMNRAHAYKSLVDQASTKGKDPDKGINMGIFTYPILMSADILMFNSHFVPVGRDQVQHVEIARNIAQRFNQYYGDTFVLPQASFNERAKEIKGLDGRKMSKSYENTIPIFCTEKKLKKLVNKITTDTTGPKEPKSTENSLVFDLYKAFASADQCEAFAKSFAEGISWGEAKAELFELLNDKLKEPREIFEQLMGKPELMEEHLMKGASRAREKAAGFLGEIKEAIGI